MVLFVEESKRSSTVRFLGVVLLCVIAAVPGGIANRIRGGWLSLPNLNPPADNVLTHDGAGRLLEAGSVALLVGVLTRRLKRGLGLGFATLVLTYFTLFIGWGCYMAIGTGNEANSRVGVYDWMVGHAQEDWSFWRFWARDIVGMSLRGLTWTAPPGLLLFLYGYGWLPMASGILQGPVYWMCHGIPSKVANFEQGTALGEFVWGWVVWMCVMAPMIALHRRTSEGVSTAREWNTTALPLTKGTYAVLHVYLGVLEALLVLSCISYGQVEQKDMRNRDQSLVGISVAAASLLLTHSIILWRQFCSKQARRKSGLYDYASFWGAGSDDDNEYGTDYGTSANDDNSLGRRALYRAHPEEVDPNPYSPHRRGPSTGLGAGYSDYASPFEDRAAPGDGRVNAFGQVRLFERGADRLESSTERLLELVNKVCCVPPDELDDGARRGSVVAVPTGSALTPSGGIVLFFSALTALWTAVWLVLAVYVAIVDNHYFGSPPGFHG